MPAEALRDTPPMISIPPSAVNTHKKRVWLFGYFTVVTAVVAVLVVAMVVVVGEWGGLVVAAFMAALSLYAGQTWRECLREGPDGFPRSGRGVRRGPRPAPRTRR